MLLIFKGRAAQRGDTQYDEHGFEMRLPNYDEYEEDFPDENCEEREHWGHTQYKALTVPMRDRKEQPS